MVDRQSKVVPLTPDKSESKVSHRALSAPVAALQDQARQSLLQFLQAMFDNTDDALFELADRAASNAEQNMYFESMREVRIQRRGMETNFVREVIDALAALAVGRPLHPDTASTEEFSISNLSLVANDELEELVAVDSMAAKAEKSFSQSLLDLTMRLDSLSAKERINTKNNPLGPTRLCQVFMGACKSLDMDIKAKLVLFKLFDRHVVNSLGVVYDNCNKVLLDAGILPRVKAGQNRRPQGSALTENPQHYRQADAPAAGEIGDGLTAGADSVFTSLQNLLARVRGGEPAAYAEQAPRAGLVAAGLAPALPRDNLMALLGDIQRAQLRNFAQQQVAALQGIDPAQLDIMAVLNKLLMQRQPNRAVSVGQVDEDAINLVSMLFQFILEDQNLATPMKALIARLQIPLLKVAMLDKSFFSKGGHPARKLLNEFANAGLGWMPNANLERDPLYRKVDTAISRLLDNFEADPGVFQDVLADFIGFMEQERRRATLVEQRTLNAEDGKAKSEIARTIVQDALNQRVRGLTLPAVVITLLRDGWSNVLFLICLKDGTESQAWINALQTVDDLIWSVQTDEKPESRLRLLKMVPALLKNLRAGLTKIGFNPYDMNQLFTELERVHLQRLKAGEASTENTAAVAAKVAPVLKPVAGKSLDAVLTERTINEEALQALDKELAGTLGEDVEANGVDGTQRIAAEALITLTKPAPQPVADIELPDTDPCVQRVDALTVGNWVEFEKDQDKKLRCRLAAIIKATGKYIFVNRAGMKVAEETRMSLANQLKRNGVALLDDGLLFDRALQSVIGNLRNMKN